jgi:hypothetical protein
VAPGFVGVSTVAGVTALGLGTAAFDPRGALLIALAAVLAFFLGRWSLVTRDVTPTPPNL